VTCDSILIQNNTESKHALFVIHYSSIVETASFCKVYYLYFRYNEVKYLIVIYDGCIVQLNNIYLEENTKEENIFTNIRSEISVTNSCHINNFAFKDTFTEIQFKSFENKCDNIFQSYTNISIKTHLYFMIANILLNQPRRKF
jgi:hypothetical protein